MRIGTLVRFYSGYDWIGFVTEDQFVGAGEVTVKWIRKPKDITLTHNLISLTCLIELTEDEEALLVLASIGDNNDIIS